MGRLKLILLLSLLSVALLDFLALGDEISHKITAPPHKSIGNNVIDGSREEKSWDFHDANDGLGKRKDSSNKVSISTVAHFTLVMAAATGLGAVPFFFVELDPQRAGLCNGMATGVMLAASFDLVQEGQEHGAGSWVVIGILSGGIFIWLCKKFLEQYGEVSMLDIQGADATKIVLIVGIMTLHSFGEGSGVGVSFVGPKGFSQGLMVTLAIAVHNIPEGLAVSMVLLSRGVSPQNAMLWSMVTSLPQPLVAVPSFICADAFNKFLPFCTGFAAGCMIWMVVGEVLPAAFKEASASEVASAAALSVAFMEALSTFFQNFSHEYSSEDASGFFVSLLFGLGPLLGGTLLVSFALAFRLQHAFLMGLASGIAFVLSAWRPLQLLISSKMGLLPLLTLLASGSLLPPQHPCPPVISIKWSCSPACYGGGPCPRGGTGSTKGTRIRSSYGTSRVPHGLPGGAAVASCIFGATDSWHGSLAAAALTGFLGPVSAIGAILAGIDYSGLDHVMVFAYGGLLPCFWRIVQRAAKLDTRKSSTGLIIGVALAAICLTYTKLVCLHTTYCNSAPEAFR
ncbi:hypothetical protein SAY86_020830 [Trapa natans]|uniref:Zinc transporter n=1 Tax=Trapa natans TaxID=22666 RepID=A0AAN7RL12_TRANT|nr:hypothetical protein SAY86_020830 [Trapa natans]